MALQYNRFAVGSNSHVERPSLRSFLAVSLHHVPDSFTIDDDLVNQALAANTDTSKHAVLVNQLLAGYGKVLKASGTA